MSVKVYAQTTWRTVDVQCAGPHSGEKAIADAWPPCIVNRCLQAVKLAKSAGTLDRVVVHRRQGLAPTWATTHTPTTAVFHDRCRKRTRIKMSREDDRTIRVDVPREPDWWARGMLDCSKGRAICVVEHAGVKLAVVLERKATAYTTSGAPGLQIDTPVDATLELWCVAPCEACCDATDTVSLCDSKVLSTMCSVSSCADTLVHMRAVRFSVRVILTPRYKCVGSFRYATIVGGGVITTNNDDVWLHTSTPPPGGNAVGAWAGIKIEIVNTSTGGRKPFTVESADTVDLTFWPSAAGEVSSGVERRADACCNCHSTLCASAALARPASCVCGDYTPRVVALGSPQMVTSATPLRVAALKRAHRMRQFTAKNYGPAVCFTSECTVQWERRMGVSIHKRKRTDKKPTPRKKSKTTSNMYKTTYAMLRASSIANKVADRPETRVDVHGNEVIGRLEYKRDMILSRGKIARSSAYTPLDVRLGCRVCEKTARAHHQHHRHAGTFDDCDACRNAWGSLVVMARVVWTTRVSPGVYRLAVAIPGDENQERLPVTMDGQRFSVEIQGTTSELCQGFRVLYDKKNGVHSGPLVPGSSSMRSKTILIVGPIERCQGHTECFTSSTVFFGGESLLKIRPKSPCAIVIHLCDMERTIGRVSRDVHLASLVSSLATETFSVTERFHMLHPRYQNEISIVEWNNWTEVERQQVEARLQPSGIMQKMSLIRLLGAVRNHSHHTHNIMPDIRPELIEMV